MIPLPFSIPLTIPTRIDPSTLLYDLKIHMNQKQLIEFVVQLDLLVADLDFTIALKERLELEIAKEDLHSF